MSQMTLIGLELATSVFQVHGVDAAGNTVLKNRLTRSQMAIFFAQVDPCLVAMEAGGSAHHWARVSADGKSTDTGGEFVDGVELRSH